MTTEQEGAPSATAGGASAPDVAAPIEEVPPHPAYVENAVAGALTDMYGFLPLGVRYGAAAAARAVVENWTRPRPVPNAEILPADRGPDLGEPGVDTVTLRRGRRYGEEAIQAMLPQIRRVGQKGQPGLELNWYDMAANAFSTVWSYCEAQTQPDPRDAEIERMRGELCRIRDIALVVLNVLPDDDDRSAVDLVREILVTAGPEKLGRDRQFSALIAERDRKRRELADVTAERDDYADRLRATDAAYVEVTAERDRWQAHYNQLIGDALHVQQHLQRALYKPVPADEEFDRTYSRSMVGELAAQLDRLHEELDRVGEQHAAGLVTLRTDFTAAVNGLLPKPAEPRRWTVGDPEPEIGTTVWRRAEKYRRAEPGWHRVKKFAGYGSWAWILSVGGEIVEAVDHG